MTLFIKLFIAYMLCEFVCQPGSWRREKDIKKTASPKLYILSLLYVILLLILSGHTDFWKYALLLGIVHLIVEATRVLLQKEGTRRWWFFSTQAIHISMIAFAGTMYQSRFFDSHLVFTDSHLLLAAALLFLTIPSSVVTKVIIAKWSPHTEDTADGSLQDAGKYIGILERLFVFGFIITQHWEAIGFFITAKSVFRFGDLKESKDRKLTEYILIGTLVSFGIAIFCGVAYLKLL